MNNGHKILLTILLAPSIVGLSQDEGTITKRSRVQKGNIIFVNVGTSLALSKADYKPGLLLDAGHLFQMNRIVSIGPSISFARYQYNSTIPGNSPTPDIGGNNIYYEDGGYQINVVYLDGGDLTFLSVGFNVKTNIIMPKGDYGVTVYGIVKPFGLYSTCSDVEAKVDIWYTNNLPPDPPSDWGFSESISIDKYSPAYNYWAKDSKIAVGLNLGLAGEYAMQSGWGFTFQGTIGLAPTVKHVDMTEFKNSIEVGFNNPNYPLVNKGFNTLNLTAGIFFRF